MFDTMTMTKLIGGLCGTLLVFMLGGWLAESIYHTGGGHGEEQAYTIEVEGADMAEAEVVEEVPFAEIYAAASAADGEGLFRACKSCHSVEAGKNGTGPSLHGVVNRPVDSVSDYSYSGALEEVVDVWTPENIFHFIESPRNFAPGTAMGFSGMRKPEDRANLIAYLATMAD